MTTEQNDPGPRESVPVPIATLTLSTTEADETDDQMPIYGELRILASVPNGMHGEVVDVIRGVMTQVLADPNAIVMGHQCATHGGEQP